MGKKNPGREGPDPERDPREVDSQSAVPQSAAEDCSSGHSHHSGAAASVQSGGSAQTVDSLFELDGPPADGCALLRGEPIEFGDGDPLLDTGWHACGGVMLRVVFTATPNPCQRQWMERLLLDSDLGSEFGSAG